MIFPIAAAVTVIAVIETMWKTSRDAVLSEDSKISTLLGVVHPTDKK